MPEEIVSQPSATTEAAAAAPPVESPPPAPMPQRREPDPRARLHELAIQLMRTQNRRLMLEYLRMRRAMA